MEPNATVLVDAASVPVSVALLAPSVDKVDVQPHRKRPPSSIASSAVSRNRISRMRAQKGGQNELQESTKVTIYDYLFALSIAAQIVTIKMVIRYFYGYSICYGNTT
jgi:hypothetical protein